MNLTHTPLSYYDPPIVELVDEECDGLANDTANHTLDEHVYSVSGDLLCSGCLRALLVRHFQQAPANDLAEYPFEAIAAERCDAGCGMFRCQCPEDR